GKVLVAGGLGGNQNSLASAELYDPATETWAATGSMAGSRHAFAATLLPSGKVLVAGGLSYTNLGVGITPGAEIYDPAAGLWAQTGALNLARSHHSATLLVNGKAIFVGGTSLAGGVTRTAEWYDVGLGFSNSWQAQISTTTSPLSLGNAFALTGSQFRGISEGSSGGAQNSSAAFPTVQLRSLESGRTIFLPSTNWSTSYFASLPVTNFPPGYALATMFVNGIPSTGSVVNVSVPVPLPVTLTGMATPADGGFRFSFTNSPGAVFGVLTTTNVSLPLTNWTALGGVAEISPGQFQFTDLKATNGLQRFYVLRAP
ncbi:MAG: Fibronectin type domain protein, partial [Pedosphaera sp.]|nr:Fibronectin type domain protein [Pedosphaera sp.]